jgi:hypothetical protein
LAFEKTFRAPAKPLLLLLPEGLTSLRSALVPASIEEGSAEGIELGSAVLDSVSPSLGEEPNILFSRPP